MKFKYSLLALIVVAAIATSVATGYRLGHGTWPDNQLFMSPAELLEPAGAASDPAAVNPKKIRFYRNPMGLPDTSPVPKKDSMGMDYLPVYAEDPAAAAPKKIKFYRNPMGLPDTSPVPKKDSMGMDYLPVYEDGDGPADDGKTIKVSLDRVQRSGMRSVAAERRRLALPVHAPGKVMLDESTLKMVTLRVDAYIEKLYVDTTGQTVKEGDPLFRAVSTDVIVAQANYRSAIAVAGTKQGPEVNGALRRLQVLGVPKSHIDKVGIKGEMPMAVEWPSPVSGTVMEKMVVEGERAEPGRALFKIADLSRLWVIADVAETDLSLIRVGGKAALTFRALPGEAVTGTVIFIYPELNPDTRTGRVRIALENPDGRFKSDMYADVVLDAAPAGGEEVTVPADALIESGNRTVVIVDKGDGRFEPRDVKLGMRGDGFVEIKSGIAAGENVVVAANFLIDAESNLQAALKAFTAEPKAEPQAESAVPPAAVSAGNPIVGANQ